MYRPFARKFARISEKQVAHAVQETIKKEVLSKILTLVDLPLPKVLLETEIAALHEDLHRRNGNQAHESCHHHGLEDEAKRRLALSLILQKIIKLENLKLIMQRFVRKFPRLRSLLATQNS